MKIYVGHSSNFPFRDKLYKPLRESKLDREHTVVLPHEDSDEIFDSKTFLREEADLFVAEVSEPSTGLGIELGWADEYEVPIICIHRETSNPSGALKAVTDKIAPYKSKKDLICSIDELIQKT